MSLLDRGHAYEQVTVYPETTVVDADGNTVTKSSDTGIDAVARFQPSNQSGTSSRRVEQDNEGFESEQLYKVRFTKSVDRQLGILGAQSKILWRGNIWHIFGDVWIHNSSRNTAHNEYWVIRA